MNSLGDPRSERARRLIAGALRRLGYAPTARSSQTRSRSSIPSMTMPGGYPVASVNASRSIVRIRKPSR
jgi:hypothetical protein